MPPPETLVPPELVCHHYLAMLRVAGNRLPYPGVMSADRPPPPLPDFDWSDSNRDETRRYLYELVEALTGQVPARGSLRPSRQEVGDALAATIATVNQHGWRDPQGGPRSLEITLRLILADFNQFWPRET
jgi:hypothetical protein